ncbi:MAG: MFS transporter [Parasphingorhabdus sp.]|uniref:MFS transporter n=1 Tax=Parasphingorhabdus sp. TaxID=2709688 RepID=UPI0032973B95
MSNPKIPSLATKLGFGFGSVAYGVKNNGFDYFLLIFYSQVLGVDAPLVGLALLIALSVDAISDPLVGYFSDNTHSRWGRRHPWMYAAIIPITFAYYFLWSPPNGLTGNELFPYLLVLSITIRLLITFYEIPCSGLIPEITDDYDQRTSLVSFRVFFGWLGGITIAVTALSTFLVPTDTIANGLMNAGGYGTYGLWASGLIFLSMSVCALSTHRLIPHLKAPPPKAPMSVGRIFGEIKETLSNRSFFAVFGTALFLAIATGLVGGLNFYFNGFFFEFTTDQMALISMSGLLSALLALIFTPRISRRLGKKRAAIIVGIAACLALPLPMLLRLFGLFPENGDPMLLPVKLALSVISTSLVISFQMTLVSMVADLAEDSEVRTKRRSEGVFFAATTFTTKAVQGLGLLAATTVLTLAEFPTGVSPGDVPEDALFRLGAYYVPAIFIIFLGSLVCLRFYKIDRNSHAKNLSTLADAKS